MKLLLFLFTIFNIVGAQGPWWSGVLPNELGAINDLKSLFDSSSLIGWDDTDPCVEGTEYNTWSGVECDNETGTHIIKIALDSAGLTGKIPASIGDLLKLKFFDLSNNNLNGTIPRSFELLQDLETLYLGGNSLTGSIPDLEYAPKLEFINVAENPLGCHYPAFLINPVFSFNVSGINFICPLPESLDANIGTSGITCAPTVLEDISPSGSYVNDEVIITIKGTGFQSNCNIKVHFGTTDRGIAIPISITETEIRVKLPINLEPEIAVPVSLSSNGEKIEGNSLSFNIIPNCSEGDVACEFYCPLTCSGHGECYILNSIPSCRCDEGTVGINCEIKLCEVLNCSGNGACDFSIGECYCDIGYELPSCATKGPCLENLPEGVTCNPELNSFGSCQWPDGLAHSVCVCDKGWFGNNCDEQAYRPETELPPESSIRNSTTFADKTFENSVSNGAFVSFSVITLFSILLNL